ncbi:MAG TPA: metallopeptidase family protein [Novosphingobium sp.]|nr:metallopeptidase family protein [Novosphingobium sp.]
MTGREPSTAELERLALAAFARIPPPFAAHLGDVVVRVEDFADAETLDDLGIENRWELTGLYHGRSLDEQSVWESGELPPLITLYRRPLLREWRETGVALDDLIAHVVIHEVGHHFGLSDEQMEEIEQGGE